MRENKGSIFNIIFSKWYREVLNAFYNDDSLVSNGERFNSWNSFNWLVRWLYVERNESSEPLLDEDGNWKFISLYLTTNEFQNAGFVSIKNP
jgi:hypothetical protein